MRSPVAPMVTSGRSSPAAQFSEEPAGLHLRASRRVHLVRGEGRDVSI